MEQVSNLKLPGIEHGFYDANDTKTIVCPMLMTQVHSADVMVVSDVDETRPQIDAWVSKTSGLTLAVYTADCAPILLADPVARVVGAVHAGWKGAFQGVIENTILAMVRQGADIKDIAAGVGPCLHVENFEVGPEMKALFPVTEHKFFRSIDGVEHFDFIAYVVYRLHRAGVSNVEVVDIDTYADTRYNSYRKSNGGPARQYSVIKLV